jgi:phosphoglycolate phosphatase
MNKLANTSPKAIIFDLDGTLLNTLPGIAVSVNRVLAARNLPQHSLEKYGTFVGKGTENLISSVLPGELRDQSYLSKCIAEFYTQYKLHGLSNTCQYSGVQDMLDFVTSKGMPLAVNSNKRHQDTQNLVGELLSNWKFEPVFGSIESIPRKPDPTSALEISKFLKIPPAEILYVGDTAVDMKTAVSAGMLPIGVRWGFRPEELLEFGAKMILEKPMDIRNLLL